jgi:hypothetical protein
MSSCQFFWIVTVSPMCQSFGPVDCPQLTLEIADQPAAVEIPRQSRGG